MNFVGPEYCAIILQGPYHDKEGNLRMGYALRDLDPDGDEVLLYCFIKDPMNPDRVCDLEISDHQYMFSEINKRGFSVSQISFEGQRFVKDLIALVKGNSDSKDIAACLDNVKRFDIFARKKK